MIEAHKRRSFDGTKTAAIAQLLTFPALSLLLIACSPPQAIPMQERLFESALRQVEQGVAEVVEVDENLFSETTLQQAKQQSKHETHLRALKRLEETLGRNPKNQSVIRSLRKHPNIAMKMFDQCYDYWLDRRPNGISQSERQKLDYEMTIRYSQRFPADIEYSQVYSIDDEKYLFIVHCLTGPYWAASANYLYRNFDESPVAKLLTLTMFEERAGKVVQEESRVVRGFPKFNEQTQEFDFWHKFRGIGDCGIAGTYGLENDQLVLQEFRAQYECNGKVRHDEFPRIYP